MKQNRTNFDFLINSNPETDINNPTNSIKLYNKISGPASTAKFDASVLASSNAARQGNETLSKLLNQTDESITNGSNVNELEQKCSIT